MNAHLNKRPLQGLPGAQQGFTLIELSIALMIGLFLLGGLLTLVQNMRHTFSQQSDLSQLQDNERLAMTLIGDVIQAAGFYPDPTTQTGTSVFPVAAGFTTSGQSIAGTRNAAAPGDSITVRFITAPNDGVINCRGRTNLSGAQVLSVNTFSVNAANGGQLMCTLTGASAAAPVALITGITNMQILYGVKRNMAIPNDNNVDTFLTAAQMAGTDWTNVSCVKVTLTLTNPLFALHPQQPPTISFTRVVTVMNRAGVNTT